MRRRQRRQRRRRWSGDVSWRSLFGLHNQFNAPVAGQKSGRGGANVGRRECPVSTEVLVEIIGVAGFREVSVDLIGLSAEPADALHAVVERRLDLVQRSLELAD